MKGTTLAQNGIARVVERSTSSERRLYACVKASRARLRLASLPDDIGQYVSGMFSGVVLRGHFVAWAAHSSEFSCKAACPPDYDQTSTSVVLANLATRRTRTLGAADDLGAIVVSAAGVAAWTEPHGDGTTDVHAMWIAGAKLLDTGAVDAGSLNVERRTVTWTVAGERRSAAV
jgi:hypothetical protein